MPAKKKVCIMTSVHQYDDVRIYHKEAKALREQGFEITILCSNFEGTDENGIEFVKVVLPKSRLLRIIIAPLRFLKAAKEVDAQYYHFHDPELLPTGLRLCKGTKGFRPAKVFYDIHEDVPRQILTKPYLKPFFAKIFSDIVERYETAAVKKFDAVIAAAPVIYDRMLPLNPNTIMVCNYPKLEEFTQTSVPYASRRNQVCYVGGITKIRGIFEMLEAIESTDIRLALAGAFETPSLQLQAEQKNGYRNATYKGFLNREGIQDLLNESKAGLVTLHPTPTYLLSLPVKMFEYMMAQVPVIASDFPYWQEIVDEAKCGICVNPLDPKEIRAAMEYIVKNSDIAEEMGQNGRRMVIEKYNWDIEKKKLLDLYGALPHTPLKG